MKKIVFVVVLIAIMLSLVPASVVFAEDAVYSDVLADLQKDESFDVSNYPIDNTDYLLHLFQVTESTDKELLVYVYQPCVEKDFRASSINISREVEDNISYRNYPLQYLNHSGTLYKYKVSDFEVYSSAVRYYNITQIMRPFDSNIDSDPGNNNTVSEVPCPVAKQWAFYKVNGNLCVECLDIETITITDKLVGFIRYSNGGFIFPPNNACIDSHLVAFSTDRQIDELKEADIQYCYQSRSFNSANTSSSSPELEESLGEVHTSDVVTLRNDQTVVSQSDRLFAHKFRFNRIQSVEDLLREEDVQVLYNGAFINISQNVEFSTEARFALQNKQWVLRFLETDVTEVGEYSHFNRYTTTRVSDVIILRLKFVTDGVVYNLGVVDNKQTGSTDPLAQTQTSVDFADDIKDLFKIFLIILALIAFCFLLWLLSPIIKLFLSIITLPFKAIKRLVSKNSEIRRSRIPDKPNSRYRRW